jgi:DNA uptake protein ComE-like DNA-binding protein
MAERHWLDPLARRLLIASGQLPRPARRSNADRPATQPSHGVEDGQVHGQAEAIERDLLHLQLKLRPGRPLLDSEEVRRAAALGWRLDVNRATAEDWLRLPGCSRSHADLLLRLQAGGVQLSGPEDLQQLLGLEAGTLQSWLPLLEFRWYGTPQELPQPVPLGVNAAAAAELQRLGGLEGENLQRLLEERIRRPFRDLADLQQRLGLPAAVIEAWIGRVSFEPPPPGPRLPPARRAAR